MKQAASPVSCRHQQRHWINSSGIHCSFNSLQELCAAAASFLLAGVLRLSRLRGRCATKLKYTDAFKLGHTGH